MHALSLLNLELFGFIPFDCWLHADYFTNLIFTTLTPIAVSLLLFGWNKVSARRQRRLPEGDDTPLTEAEAERVEANIKNTQNALISAFLLLTFVVLPGCSTKIFATFKCNDYYFGESDHEKERYLAMDLSVPCGYPSNTEKYTIMQVYAFIMILICEYTFWV